MKLDKLEQLLLDNLLENSKRILLLKQRNRFTAAKAATGSTPRMNAGACAPLSGHQPLILRTIRANIYATLISKIAERAKA
jgi:hypothetical protein